MYHKICENNIVANCNFKKNSELSSNLYKTFRAKLGEKLFQNVDLARRN